MYISQDIYRQATCNTVTGQLQYWRCNNVLFMRSYFNFVIVVVAEIQAHTLRLRYSSCGKECYIFIR